MKCHVFALNKEEIRKKEYRGVLFDRISNSNVFFVVALFLVSIVAFIIIFFFCVHICPRLSAIGICSFVFFFWFFNLLRAFQSVVRTSRGSVQHVKYQWKIKKMSPIKRASNIEIYAPRTNFNRHFFASIHLWFRVDGL